MAEGLKPCRVCHREVAESAANCPHCGAELVQETSMQMIVRVIITLAVIFVLVRILAKISEAFM